MIFSKMDEFVLIIIMFSLGHGLEMSTFTTPFTEPTEEPVSIQCPSSISVSNDLGSDDAVVSWGEPAVDGGDPRETFVVQGSYQPGMKFHLGTTTVTYSVRKALEVKGPVVAECTFDITVTDTEKPSVTCPENIEYLTRVSKNVKVTWKTPSYSDNSGHELAIPSHKSGDEFPIGVTTVVYRVRDPAGNVNSCSFNISIQEVTITCPSDISKMVEGADGKTHVSWSPPHVHSDGEAEVTIKCSHNSGEVLNIGTSRVTSSVYQTNNDRLIADCSFDIKIIGVEVLCPETFRQETDRQVNSSLVFWDKPIVTTTPSDEEDNLIWTNSTHTPGMTFYIGATTVSYYVFSLDGDLVTSCIFDVLIVDLEKPTIVCPDAITVLIGADDPRPEITWNEPESSDNSGTVNITSTHKSEEIFPAGTTYVLYTATDMSGNEATCNFTVIVIEVAISCPQDIRKAVDGILTSIVVTWDLPEVQGGERHVHVTGSRSPNSEFSVGATTEVTYDVMDEMNATLTWCSFDVVIHGVTIICPEDIKTETDVRSDFATVTWNAPEVIGGDEYVEVNQTGESGQEFQIGSSSITYVVTDIEGKIVTNCSLDVHVADKEKPKLLCPEDIMVLVKPFVTPLVTWTLPLVSDNAGYAEIINATAESGDMFSAGTTEVKYVAVDAYGNENMCSFSVDVKEVTLECPDPFNVSTDKGKPFAFSVRWPLPTVHGTSMHLDITSDMQQGETFDIGNHTITFTASDNRSFETECKFTFSVNDIEPPSIQCGPDEKVNIYSGNTSTQAFWKTVTSSDNSGELVQVVSNHVSGEVFQIGSTEVTYVATDNSGNEAVCHFNVIVSVLCPSNVSFTAEFGYISWPSTLAGSEAVSNTKCPFNGNVPVGTRRCLADSILGAVWADPEIGDCNNTNLYMTMATETATYLTMVTEVRTKDYQTHLPVKPIDSAHLHLYGQASCYITIVTLFLGIVCLLAKREWRLHTHRQILFHYYLSILAVITLVLLVGQANTLPFGCVVIKVLFHFFVLTTMAWSAVEAQYLYVAAVKMDDVRTRCAIVICCVVGWLIPALPVGISAWLRPEEADHETPCILYNDVVGYFTFILPCCVLCLHNITVYFLTIIQLCKTSSWYPLYRHVSFRLLEAVSIFTFVLVTMVFVNIWITVPSLAFQLTFSITCLCLGAIICTLNGHRLLCTPSQEYDLNKRRSVYATDDENDLKLVIYMGHDDLDMAQSGNVTPQIIVEPLVEPEADRDDDSDTNFASRSTHRRQSSFGHILDDPRVECQGLNACASTPAHSSTHSRTNSIDLVLQKNLVVEIEDVNGRPRSRTDSFGRKVLERPQIRVDNLHDLKDLDDDKRSTHSRTSSFGSRVEFLRRELSSDSRSRTGSLGRRVDYLKEESDGDSLSRRRSGSFSRQLTVQERPRSIGSRKSSFHVLDSASIDDIIGDNPNEDCRIECSEHDINDVCLMSSVL